MALLEGLEISEVLFSALNAEMRYESQFHLKKYLLEAFHLGRHPLIPLGELAFITDGAHGYHEVDEDSPIHMLTAKCAKNWEATIHTADRISEKTHLSNLRSSLEVNDLILSTRGTVGPCAIVRKNILPANLDQDVARISLDKPSKTFSYFLCAYLNSSYGQDRIKRVSSGMVQQGISLQKTREIPIPILDDEFIRTIGSLVSSGLDRSHESKILQAQAEQALLSALDLENWQPPNPLTYEAASSAAFSAGRLDAEYFHPEKSEMISFLKNQESKPLSHYVESVRSILNPKTEGKSFMVINYDLSDALNPVLNPNNPPAVSNELGSTKKFFQNGDLVVSRLRSYLKEIAVVPEMDASVKRVGSTEFIVLRPRSEKISVKTLCVFLRSVPAQVILKWCIDGSQHPRFSESDLMDIPVPDNLVDISKGIDELFDNANIAKQHSKALLERAKRAVEIAIEQDEETALAYLDGKHYVAEELLPKLFGISRHYVDLATIQQTIEAEALQYEPATIKRYLQEWMREGRIYDAGRGWYSDLEDEFFPAPKIPIFKSLSKKIKEEFPFLEYTMWSTRELIPFFHHLPTRHATFLMVDRDALEPVADALREAGHHVVVHPLGNAAKSFSLQEDDTIIIRPRLSADHSEKRSPIEHTLVDLFYEVQKLGLYELAEYHRLFQNLTSTNRINITALKRYAERRKIEPSEILPFIG